MKPSARGLCGTLLAGLIVVIVGGCGPAAATPAASPPPDFSGKTLPFAAVLSLSGAGEAIGKSQKQGIELAVAAVNSAGGVHGARIAVDIQDDASVPKQSADLFQKAITERKALGVIGPTLAIAAAVAHPVASGLKVPVIAPSLVGAGVVGQCAYPCTHVFRASISEAQAIPDNVKTLSRKAHPRSAVVIFANDDTASVADSILFQHALADNAIQAPAASVLQVAKNATTVTDVVTAALARKADAWVIATPGPVAVLVMTEARKQGYRGPFAGGNSFNAASISTAGDAGTGAQSATAYFPGLAAAANKAFVAAYRARYKDTDGKPQDPDMPAAQAYSAVLLFATAARNTNLAFGNPAPDRLKLEKALGTVGVDSPMGTLGFTVQNDASQPVYVVAADGKGGFTLVETYPAR